jgi:hypothetical protein
MTDTITEIFERSFPTALGSTTKHILPGDIFHATRVLGKGNKGIFHYHVFFLIWTQFLKTHRIE